MLISISDFRGLVDSMSPRLNRDAEIEEAKRFVGLEAEPNYQRSKIDEVLRERIQQALHQVVKIFLLTAENCSGSSCTIMKQIMLH